MAYTTTYRYTADVHARNGNGNVTTREGEVTVGGAEGHVGARRLVQAQLSAEGLTVRDIRFQPTR
jgi:hypothetical protein